MPKKFVRMTLLLLLGAAAGGLLTLWVRRWRGDSQSAAGSAIGAPSVAHSPPAPTLEQVRRLSSLVTLVAEVSDVRVTRLVGRTGSVEAVLLARGDVELSVDLGQALFERVDHEARRAVLVLPDPRPARPRLDHARTRVVWLGRSGLWALVPGGGAAEARLVEESHRRAQAIVEGAAEDPVLVEQSRRHAEQVTRAFFAAAGWDVTVRWSGRP